uniref:Uncharacterized protein n=1 Tax=Seriola lalandi dorsalis TaxID=1841481 RepID=A0A3B4XQA7_SERLL
MFLLFCPPHSYQPVCLCGAARAAECRPFPVTSSPQPDVTRDRLARDEALHQLSAWGQRRGVHAWLGGISKVRAQRSVNSFLSFSPNLPLIFNLTLRPSQLIKHQSCSFNRTLCMNLNVVQKSPVYKMLC